MKINEYGGRFEPHGRHTPKKGECYVNGRGGPAGSGVHTRDQICHYQQKETRMSFWAQGGQSSGQSRGLLAYSAVIYQFQCMERSVKRTVKGSPSILGGYIPVSVYGAVSQGVSQGVKPRSPSILGGYTPVSVYGAVSKGVRTQSPSIFAMSGRLPSEKKSCQSPRHGQ